MARCFDRSRSLVSGTCAALFLSAFAAAPTPAAADDVTPVTCVTTLPPLPLDSPWVTQVELPDGTTEGNAYTQWLGDFQARMAQFSCSVCPLPAQACLPWAGFSANDHDVVILEKEGPTDTYRIIIWGGVVTRGCYDCD